MQKWGQEEKKVRKELGAKSDKRTPHKGVEYSDGVHGPYAIEVKYSISGFKCKTEDWKRAVRVAVSMGKIPILVLSNGETRMICFDFDIFDVNSLLKVSKKAVKPAFSRFVEEG